MTTKITYTHGRRVMVLATEADPFVIAELARATMHPGEKIEYDPAYEAAKARQREQREKEK